MAMNMHQQYCKENVKSIGHLADYIGRNPSSLVIAHHAHVATISNGNNNSWSCVSRASL